MSQAEENLAIQLTALGVEFEREFMFAKEIKRRWRSDFRIGKLLIEVEGGGWTKGRHTRGAGFEKDMEKYNAAALLGYTVLRFSPAMIDSGKALQTIEKMLE